MWIIRDLEQKIQSTTEQRPVVMLTGARQTGKTSLLKRLFPNRSFVSLDLPSEAEQAERDPRDFLKRHTIPLTIDEVQYAPQIFRHLKSVVDAERERAGIFLLTGSQKFSLMKEISESLAGRVEIIELESLSWHEILQSYRDFSVSRVMLRGGFPELYRNIDLDPYSFHRSYVSTYLERDLRSILNVTSLRDFERFIRACALRSGQLVNKAEIARDVGISAATANQWLGVLEASNQIVLLEPWFRNKSKSLVKSPKLYMSDTGLLCYLLNIKNESELVASPHIGNIWETFVFAELRKNQTARYGSWSIYFWSDRRYEVDFLIPRGGIFDLLEVKWTETPDKFCTQNLDHVRKVLGEKQLGKSVVVCRAANSYPISAVHNAVPLRDLWESNLV